MGRVGTKTGPSSSSSSFALFGSDDAKFEQAILQQQQQQQSADAGRGRVGQHHDDHHEPSRTAAPEEEQDEPERQAAAAAAAAQKRAHDEQGDEYDAINFGEFGRYMHNKRLKLQHQNRERVELQQRAGAEARPQIFDKVKVYVNGFTDKMGHQQFVDLIVLHGGTYIPYLDQKSLVTHIVATNLTPSKRKEFASYRVVTPDWMIDSAQAGKLLDWTRYSLFERDLQGGVGAQRQQHGARNEDEARLGAPSAQRSLFAMGLGATKPISDTRKQPVASTSKAPATGEPSPEPPSDDGATTTPSKRRRPLPPPTTDFAAANLSAYLPANTSKRNADLLQDEDWLNEHTSRNPNYLKGYFEKSRLHHLSTWKARLIAKHADEQRAKFDANIPVRKLKGTVDDQRTILHVDFDCFFVSAGLTSRPHLRGKPVAVCHASGLGADKCSSTSEIASCSYEARAFGVANGISFGRAREKCPEIQAIPFEFELYERFSDAFYDVLLRNSDALQAISIDEAIIEVSSRVPHVSAAPEPASKDDDPAIAFAERLRSEIRDATGCEASIGIGHNILLARLATKKAKPAGAFHLLPSAVRSFLDPLPVDALPGIGWSLSDKLGQIKVDQVGSLVKMAPGILTNAIGPGNSAKYLKFAEGVDDRELDFGKARGSVSVDINYGIRFSDNAQVERFMYEMGQEVSSRMKEINVRGRFLTVSIMKRAKDAPVQAPKFLGHGHCTTHHESSTLSAPKGGGATDDPAVIGNLAWRLASNFGFPPEELRGITVQVTKLEGPEGPKVRLAPGQTRLKFGAPAPSSAREGAIVEIPGSSGDGAPPPAQQARASASTSPDVVELGSDTSVEEAPVKPRKDVKGKRKASEAPATSPPPKEAYIFKAARRNARKLRPRASQVPDEAIKAIGWDPAVFRELSKDHQQELLNAQRPADLRAALKPTKKAFAGPSTEGKTKTRQPPRSPEEEDVVCAGYDLEVFRQLDDDSQRELLRSLESRDGGGRKTFATKSTTTTTRKSPAVPPSVANRTLASVPLFKGSSNIEHIESFIEDWVEGVGQDGLPRREDVEDMRRYLVLCTRRPGQSLSKVSRLLAWWTLNVELHAKPGSPMSVALAGVTRDVDAIVSREWGHSMRL